MDGKCASRSNVYPYTSCCVLDIHFVLKNNFCVNLFDGNLILLCILFVFFLDICTILFILCKKKTNKQNKTTDAIYFLSDQENYLRMTGRLCVRVRPKSEWWGGVRRQSDGERAKPASLCLLLSLFFLGDRVWFRMYRCKKQVIVSFKKKKERHLNATCSLLRNQTFANLSEGQLVNVELKKVRRFRSTPEWQFGFI